jgi:hypothetical protein
VTAIYTLLDVTGGRTRRQQCACHGHPPGSTGNGEPLPPRPAKNFAAPRIFPRTFGSWEFAFIFPALTACGIDIAPVTTVLTAEGALAAAAHAGYPVVLKGAGPALLHRTEAKGSSKSDTSPFSLAGH